MFSIFFSIGELSNFSRLWRMLLQDIWTTKNGNKLRYDEEEEEKRNIIGPHKRQHEQNYCLSYSYRVRLSIRSDFVSAFVCSTLWSEVVFVCKITACINSDIPPSDDVRKIVLRFGTIPNLTFLYLHVVVEIQPVVTSAAKHRYTYFYSHTNIWAVTIINLSTPIR